MTELKTAKVKVENSTHKSTASVPQSKHTLFRSCNTFIGWAFEFLIGNSDRIEMSKFQRIQMPKAGIKMFLFLTRPTIAKSDESISSSSSKKTTTTKHRETTWWLELFQMNFKFALKFWQISFETFANEFKVWSFFYRSRNNEQKDDRRKKMKTNRNKKSEFEWKPHVRNSTQKNNVQWYFRCRWG